MTRLTERLDRSSGRAALVVSLAALVLSAGGLASAAKLATKPSARKQQVVSRARTADRLGNRPASAYVLGCPESTVDLGTWCLDSSTFVPTAAQIGKNDYLFASQTCVAKGGYLPTAAQLVGAAARVKLASTIDDSDTDAAIDEDPSDGLKDKREMSATLVTTSAGSSAAGSEGVTQGSRGNPQTGEPDPAPQPADPQPSTLQYVTVYDNHDRGGFAGSVPVAQPMTFRCAYAKQQGDAVTDLG